ncbi:MAG: SDR family NAD(P)-dependent oxidoreductase [Candidatus Odinarchaeota archaeon]
MIKLKDEKIILITGSTDGIGYQTAVELVKLGYTVIIHGRNQEKAELTIQRIKNDTNQNNIRAVYADLSSFSQIKDMSNMIYNHFDKLDVLINNAGVYKPKRQLTQEGLEETFAVNYVAPFLLTNLLLNLLRNAKSSRIVNVVSRVQSNHLDLKNLQFETGYTGVKAYALSKTCLIMYTYILAQKLRTENITVNCLHPGVINTKLQRTAMGFGGLSPSEGAKNLIYAATSPKLEDISGAYFMNNKSSPTKDITYNKELQQKLWKKTEQLVGIEFKQF